MPESVKMEEGKLCRDVRKFVLAKGTKAPVAGIYIDKSIAGSWPECYISWDKDGVHFTPTKPA